MSDGNNPALPEGQQPTVDPNDPTGQQQQQQQQQQAGQDDGKNPGLTFTHPQPPEDADDIVLRELAAKAEAEEAETAGKTQNDPNQGKDPATVATKDAQQGQPPPPGHQQQQQPPAGEQQTIMVPKARLDEALRERDQLREQAAYQRGRAEALETVAPAQAGQQHQQQQPQPTPEQKLADIKQKRIDLAKQFDEGEITSADWQRRRDELDDQAQAIREEQLAAKFKPVQQQDPQPQGDTLYLNQLTARIEKDHPWIKVFEQVADQTRNEADWDYIANMAKANLKERGVVLNGSDEARYLLRKEIGIVADKMGPALLAERAKAMGIELPGTQQQQPQPGQNQLSPAAQARKAALDKAAGAPPDLAKLTGTTGDPTGITEERLETMKEDDFDKLPAAVRNKLLGISAA
jgi:hypothetical protein